MLICKKKRCIWRVYCGEGKYYCHKAGNCPNVMTAKEKLPKVKWSGIIKSMRQNETKIGVMCHKRIYYQCKVAVPE